MARRKPCFDGCYLHCHYLSAWNPGRDRLVAWSKAMIECLATDERTIEARLWPRWMKAADTLVSRFAHFDDDPFSYNETASVSLLCSAATRCGYLAFAEYATTKRGRKDKRERGHGRCD